MRAAAGWPLREASYVLGVALGACACQPSSALELDEAAQHEAAVINGADDRRELYELESGAEREILERAVAALMWAHRLDVREPARLRATSAEEALGLCPDERFADEPSAAFCSATLIDDDLVLTAGHCLGEEVQGARERCRRLWIVFGDHYAEPGQLALDSTPDVYACRQVVVHEHTAAAENFGDFAVIQLDRPVGAGRERVLVEVNPPPVGTELVAAAHGAGLPLKVDHGGVVSGLA